ncbi:hypothetical protein [Novosphingobium sp. ERN07]|uniref:hypothetical protein n=1 Tax=Novosphingobium sp. ERN07 TaxID=2726187 RepID=UPI00197E3026|nr:hypothetical protein [Novosphingobium sp. ERN07]
MEPATGAQHTRVSKRYQTDLSDAEWALINPCNRTWHVMDGVRLSRVMAQGLSEGWRH